MLIRKLTSTDINSASRLHFETLPDISTALGLLFVKKMYQLLIRNPKIHLCFGVWDKKELVGMVTSSINTGKTHKMIYRIFTPETFFLIFQRTITGKISPLRLIKRLRFEKKLAQIIPHAYPGIVTLCVAKKYQRRGIGRLLIKCSIKQISKLRVNKLYVDTNSFNREAISFYKSVGFKILFQAFGTAFFEYMGTLLRKPRS